MNARTSRRVPRAAEEWKLLCCNRRVRRASVRESKDVYERDSERGRAGPGRRAPTGDELRSSEHGIVQQHGQGTGYGGHTGTRQYYPGEAPRGAAGYGGYGSTGEYGYGSTAPTASPESTYYPQAGYGRAGYAESNFGHGGYSGVPATEQNRAAPRRVPRSYRRSDERIAEDLCERLAAHAYVDASEVSVAVRDGCVLLEGTVPQRRMKHTIEDLAADCPGVQEVENRSRVARTDEGSRAASAAPDSRASGPQSLSGGDTGGASQEGRSSTP